MNVFDENIRADQREMLRAWRIPVRQIGHRFTEKALTDENIIPLLLRLSRPTFFTHDRDFDNRRLGHQGYCLVILYVPEPEAAGYVRRVLRHPAFDTWAKRMGSVIRVTPTGIMVWRLHAEAEEHIPWPTAHGRAQRPAAR